ncbi:MAG: hypothetical protein LUQ11_16070, partial [Methylococcaceae bacterium]|nr:hypothetical protein [Methylococcaceae bacterium]
MFASYRICRTAWLITVLCAIGWTLPVEAAEKGITPNEVFSEALQIEKEVDLLKRHYDITGVNPGVSVEADVQFRHVWEKCYVILLKLSIFRRNHGLPGFAPLALEPNLDLNPNLNWAQTQRILSEVMIIKKLLGIPGTVSPATLVQDKRPIDVFNKLEQISYAMDLLNGSPVRPSDVYAEALRVNEDVNSIMRKIGTLDTAVPPARNPNAQPVDSLNAAFVLLNEIQRLQRQLGLDITDFSAFHKT